MGRRLGRRRKRIVVTSGANGRRAFVPYEAATLDKGAAFARAPSIDGITEQEARALMEKIIWPNGPKCTKCGNEGHGTSYDLGTRREGLRKCKRCEAHYSITTGTPMEYTKLRLKDWVLALDALAKNPDARECEFVRLVGTVGYKSAGIIRKRIQQDAKLLDRYRRYMERARA